MIQLGTVCHEIAHALGFYHTQSRSDRDSYIYINYGNVDGSLQYNFQKLSTSAEKHYGMAYDYGSVMQYNPYAFAINYNIPTSVARDVNYQNMMGQRDGPAFSDVKQMNLLYNCAGEQDAARDRHVRITVSSTLELVLLASVLEHFLETTVIRLDKAPDQHATDKSYR
ncbi:astacin [Necator americanus]|uniref:Metalloendopeptidase n=1 Tax=Necator americanus TaxID=51031 RepID=W2T2R7_NECAM|nr:astacin [Necator americanus]ETN76285.1 astacin [Necator americanus]